MEPEIRYASVGDTAVAYTVIGDGPIDLVLAPPVITHLEMMLEEPRHRHFLERLASFARVMVYDKRGTGISDPMPGSGVPSLEERMDEILAVMDGTGSERASLFGYGEGVLLCVLFAATYPDRTTSMTLFNGTPKLIRSEDYPIGWEPGNTPMEESAVTWGRTFPFTRFMPSLENDERFKAWYLRFQRAAASPGIFRAIMRSAYEMDTTHVLSAISVPTLVMHRADNEVVNVANGRYMAENIAGAKYIELPGGDHYPWFSDTDAIVDEVQEFVTGVRPAPEIDRVLCTVLFTDIVSSTERAAEIGDRRWRELLGEHHGLVRRELERFRGREIDTAGDGFLATFDGPARAVKCAWAVEDSVRNLDIHIRAGAHTGECELIGDKVAGIAVHIASRVASQAGPGEVLVSSTVKDLVAGSGIRFDDRGTHTLKGIPDEWHLYSAER